MLWRRKEARLTQELTAERSGLARSYISELENGKYMPTIDALFRLAYAFDVSPTDLIAEIERRLKAASGS